MHGKKDEEMISSSSLRINFSDADLCGDKVEQWSYLLL